MKIRVLYFSVLRDLAGAAEEDLELEDGRPWTAGEALDLLCRMRPALRDWDGRALLAVDQEWAGAAAPLREGCELAVMPPVQGG